MIFDQFNLKNRIALVTGASRGIGQAIAIALGQAGASVAVHYSQREDAALETASQIQRSCIVQADLANPLASETIVADTRHKLGDPDIVVANASVQYNRKWNDYDETEFDEQVNVNLRSVLRLIQLTAPAMIERKWGRILTIGSVQQYRPHVLMMPYAALKSGMENLCRNFAKQLGPHGITVNNLAPGVIATDRNAAALSNPDRVEQLHAGIAVGFIGKPLDCAAPAPHVVLRQGETGAPSESQEILALKEHPWSERKQASWILRRMLAHHARGIAMSLFQLADMQYTKDKGAKFEGRNSKGLLYVRPDKTVAYRKSAFFAAQHLYSLIDDTFPLLPLENLADSPATHSLHIWNRHPLAPIAGWWRNDIAPDLTNPAQLDLIRLDPIALDEPVLIDLISGHIFAPPSGDFWSQLPCTDSPLMLTSRHAISTQELS